MLLEEKIVRQTIQLFQEKGLKFTLDELASELRISKKTIYQYFPSKEAILNEVVEFGFGNIQAKKAAILESDLNTVDKLKTVLIAMPNEYEQIDFSALKDLETTYPQVAQNLQEHFEADWEPIFALIEQGIYEESIRPVNLVVLKMTLTSAFNYFLATDDLEETGLTYREALREMVDIILHGLILSH